MCGIVGYIGSQDAYDILIKGLKRLEYRGYDSAGINLMNGKPITYKKKGKVSDLEQATRGKPLEGTMGIAHTRWATHGEPTDKNAHPHASMNGKFYLIHNGIIENYGELKNSLIEKGYTFQSETDTEVLVNLIEYTYLQGNGEVDFEMAVRFALSKVIGAYGIVVTSSEEQDKLVAARKGSPLVIGIGNNEYFLASDATPIVEHTKRVIYLNNDEIAVIRKNELTLKTIDNYKLSPKIQKLDMDITDIQKGGYEHFMLKEIYEQVEAIKDTFRGRISPEREEVSLGGLYNVQDKLFQANRFIIVACGTSWHAGLIGEYLIEEMARVPVEVEYGSEFRYRDPILNEKDVVIAISQSGETADTLAAIELAKQKGATVLGVCNVVGASIPRETHAGVYTHAGPEIGVASTKAFTTQVTVLAMMAMMLGRQKGLMNRERFAHLVKELHEVPDKIQTILQENETLKEIAATYKNATNALFLGRGHYFPVALEGALKLKEISYIHAEGYPAAEMKHGPIALIDEDMPVFVIATKDKSYEKIVSNIQEVKSRHGKVIAIVTRGDEKIREMADHCVEIPYAEPDLTSLLAVIPLQLVSYHIAVMRGCNVDQPRNLAKSVTVE